MIIITSLWYLYRINIILLFCHNASGRERSGGVPSVHMKKKKKKHFSADRSDEASPPRPLVRSFWSRQRARPFRRDAIDRQRAFDHVHDDENNVFVLAQTVSNSKKKNVLLITFIIKMISGSPRNATFVKLTLAGVENIITIHINCRPFRFQRRVDRYK